MWNIHLPRGPYSTLREKNTHTHPEFYLNVHSSFISNSPKLDTPQCPKSPSTVEGINKLWRVQTVDTTQQETAVNF